MTTSPDSGHPQEFEVDTSGARPLDPADGSIHLEQLLGFRDWLTRRERELSQQKRDADESHQTQRGQSLKIAATAVGIVDELRLLLADARRNLAERKPGSQTEQELKEPEKTTRRPGLLGRLFARRQSDTPPSGSAPWLLTFERLAATAINQLESQRIFHVPLRGQDLRDLSFRGQQVKRWVAVKNRPRQDKLVVTKEMRGLWVGELEGRLVPIQRGEVMV
ncbi:MAG: hypothetical protein A2V98_05755 [Planctomycetes bacterium RBG_16_64_12]|nr:MAG: hypothetical protein A2V98_05755 [Planctomycetes bacterium RBG_16_64_12]